MPITTPYPVVLPFDKKREMAKVMSNTVYVYDFLELIEYDLLRQWRKYVQQRTRGGGSKITIPNLLMETRELILDATGKALSDTTRPRGQNDIGMVTWLLTLYTPEFQDGREPSFITNPCSESTTLIFLSSDAIDSNDATRCIFLGRGSSPPLRYPLSSPLGALKEKPWINQ
ncbi:hypothetical protein PsorP6_008706 [Peronosclerospora sorghi]|uniref:Uncharacterized protein n=1 Tax=Peronosclerospora sorghi TaxID=230839 RepID=A0ACC0W0A8_9STRA|nr:hypothetical protein PsorP6_008706 [Peronosclerospora sorghi]